MSIINIKNQEKNIIKLSIIIIKKNTNLLRSIDQISQMIRILLNIVNLKKMEPVILMMKVALLLMTNIMRIMRFIGKKKKNMLKIN